MTKKNFIALADEMRTLMFIYKDRDGIPPQALLNTLADFCATQNPEFNRARWLGYIAATNGRNGGKVKGNGQ